MFKLTLVIWMLTGSQMTVEADGFKTEAHHTVLIERIFHGFTGG